MTQNPNSRIVLPSVLAQLQSSSSLPFESAHPLPAVTYHSDEFFRHERQSVFMQEWICVGREDEIASHGDFLTFDIACYRPVLIIPSNGIYGSLCVT